jgi:hypothetical protein
MGMSVEHMDGPGRPVWSVSVRLHNKKLAAACSMFFVPLIRPTVEQNHNNDKSKAKQSKA